MKTPSLYYSVVVTKKLLCNCSSYKFPHNPESIGCLLGMPQEEEQLHSLPCRASQTSIKRAKDFLRDGYL